MLFRSEVLRVSRILAPGIHLPVPVTVPVKGVFPPKQKCLKPLLALLETPLTFEEVPMERFEPSTLAGPVFETGAYTVPPHRLAEIANIIIAHH